MAELRNTELNLIRRSDQKPRAARLPYAARIKTAKLLVLTL
jgi:hypothetical protein